MQQHLGEEFIGNISAVTEFGLFVTLKDLYVDGMIHVSQLGDDFFIYDQASQSLVGQNRGQIFGLGDEVKIKVAGVNLDERKIDFELTQQITHAGRIIRSRAPRTTKAQATEQVFHGASDTQPREQQRSEKKDKSKPSSYTKKTGKKKPRPKPQ